MATRTKAKPAAAKGKAKNTKAQKPAAPKAAAKPKKVAILENGAFAKFTGYQSEMPKDEVIFNQDDLLIILASEETEDGVLYDAVKAEDYADFLEDEDSVEGGQVAAGEISAIKGGALTAAKERFIPVPVVGKLADMLEENDDAVAVAVALNEEINESYFWMGGALAKVLQEGLHLKENGGDFEGEDAFNDFCQDNFGFKASKGRTLARIYSTYSALEGFDPNSLAGIGWSLAAKAEKYVTEENVDEVLDVVSSDGVNQRNADFELSQKFAKDGTSDSGRSTSRNSNAPVTKTLTFRLEEVSAEVVEMALQQMMKQGDIASEALALEAICSEWAGEFAATQTTQKRIASKARAAAKGREMKAEGAKAPAKTKAAAKGRKK